MSSRIQFNADVANALVHGAAIPVPFVQQFVQQAYDTFIHLQGVMRKLQEKENECSNLQKEVEGIKSLLLEAEDELKLVQAQRNAGNRKIVELQDQTTLEEKN